MGGAGKSMAQKPIIDVKQRRFLHRKSLRNVRHTVGLPQRTNSRRWPPAGRARAVFVASRIFRSQFDDGAGRETDLERLIISQRIFRAGANAARKKFQRVFASRGIARPSSKEKLEERGTGCQKNRRSDSKPRAACRISADGDSKRKLGNERTRESRANHLCGGARGRCRYRIKSFESRAGRKPGGGAREINWA